MVVITVIELGTGKPIDASVWGRHQTGTTLGGGHSTTATPSTTPTTSTTPTQSPTSQGVQQNQSTAPSTGASTGAPTPSSVPTVGPTPTVRAPASVGASAPG